MGHEPKAVLAAPRPTSQINPYLGSKAMPHQHHSMFQMRDDTGKWSGGFVERFEGGGAIDRRQYAEGGAVKDEEKNSRGLAEIPRHLGAAAGMADYALGGLPSTAVGLVHGLMPGGPGYSDVKAASEAALEDFQGLYPNIADPMLEMLDNPMGAGFFGLPAFLRRASRGASAADRLAKAKADLDAANADLRRMGASEYLPPRASRPVEDQIKEAERASSHARSRIEQLRRDGMQRARDLAEGRIPKALPAPGPGDFPPLRGRRVEIEPDDFIRQRLRTLRGGRPVSLVRAENEPTLAGSMADKRRMRERDAFRRRRAVEDDLAGGPAQRALMRQDQNVDEFVSNVLGRYRQKTLPDLPDDKVAPRMRGVERFIVNEALDPMAKGALGDSLPISDAVKSMMRRGYALPGMNMSVLQDRNKGRFMANTPAEREFKSAVRQSPEGDSAILRVLKRLREQ